MYTRGEWKSRKQYANRWLIESHRAGFVPNTVAHVTLTVCEVGTGSEAEHEANARLIAAAPDLLEACKKALDYFDRGNAKPELGVRAIIAIQAAIARATEGK